MKNYVSAVFSGTTFEELRVPVSVEEYHVLTNRENYSPKEFLAMAEEITDRAYDLMADYNEMRSEPFDDARLLCVDQFGGETIFDAGPDIYTLDCVMCGASVRLRGPCRDVPPGVLCQNCVDKLD